MFKKFVVGIILGMLTTSAQVGIKISGYPRAASLGDNDLFITAYYNGSVYTTNKSIAFTNLTSQLLGIVNSNIKFGVLTGMLKVTGGTPGTATPGVDYQNPFSTGAGITNLSQVVSVMITNNDATITTTTNSGGVIGIGTVGLATQANLTTVSNTVNGKQAAFSTGLGITNVANVLSNNIVAGANITITTGANGQETIASTATPGTTGTVINSGSSTANAIPIYSNTTGTNVTPALVTITGGTNVNAGALTIGTGGTPFTITYANGGNITNGGNSVTVTNDIAQKFNVAVTIGSSSGMAKLTSGVVGTGTAGTDYSTPTSTDTFQNKTFDAAATGNTIKFKSYIPFLTPGFSEGIGAIPNTNDYTVATFGHYKFSGSAATNANYVVYGPISVPTDIDTSVDLRARLKVRLSATETSASTFNLGVQDVADSASGSFAGAGNWVAVAIAADASGAANDLETSAWITLTGWKSALTSDHSMFIVLNRDGAGDTANTGIWEAELKLEYGVTQ